MAQATKRIDNPIIIETLAQAIIHGQQLKLPRQLDRKLYSDVNKVLEGLGGKWNRKAGAHIFQPEAGELADLIDGVVTSGTFTDLKKLYDAFPTPQGFADTLVGYLPERLHARGTRFLEPSAGHGTIASSLQGRFPSAAVDVCELNPLARAVLERKGFRVVGEDFLSLVRGIPAESRERTAYDAIVANPPFSRKQDVDHVDMMLDLLMFKVPSALVSVMSAGIKFREDKRTAALRDRIKMLDGRIIDNPPGTFEESGTSVHTVTVLIGCDE